MRIVDQHVMNRLFEVTDEIPIDREAITVPLEMQGDGDIRHLSSGKIEIILPDVEDLTLFLAQLPGRLRS